MWAIVTGGSSGLGLAIAARLAVEGYNLVLVSRNADKLDAAAADIRGRITKKGGKDVEILLVPLDLSLADAAEKLHTLTSERGIAPQLLVNDAGMYIYGHLTEVEPSRQQQLLNLNINTLTSLCRLYGASMESGHILNIASYSVYMPIEGFSLYAASKAYVRTFSRCLGKELGKIKVTAVAPAGMDTGLMHLRPGIRKLAGTFGFLAKPDTVARISLRVMRIPFIHYWIPLWPNVLFIPFLPLLQPIFKKVLKYE